MFDFDFMSSTWNTGFVSLPGNLFLLVTLEKGGKEEKYRYRDRFLSRREFQWQSQNRTTQSGKHGQQIQNHQEKSLAVHLLVRRSSKEDGRAAPFTYCGQLLFKDWEGERPITVRWEMKESIPDSLYRDFTSHEE